MRLIEKVAIITGAKSGIGFATAARFAAEGARVILADLKDSQPEAETIAKGGGETISFQTDVSGASGKSLIESAAIQETADGDQTTRINRRRKSRDCKTSKITNCRGA
jgi:NAD(P)-dependent dehydrogenase (short-subunit alcohol dehydrogenase family)